jgi:hypothetical protein
MFFFIRGRRAGAAIPHPWASQYGTVLETDVICPAAGIASANVSWEYGASAIRVYLRNYQRRDLRRSSVIERIANRNETHPMQSIACNTSPGSIHKKEKWPPDSVSDPVSRIGSR